MAIGINKKMIKKFFNILWIPLLAYIVMQTYWCGKKEIIIEQEKSSVVENVEEEKKELKLIKTDFSELFGWQEDNVEEAKKSFLLSCTKINEIKKEFIYDSEIKIPTKIYKKLCLDVSLYHNFNEFIELNFTPYIVTENDNEVGKFTSYYESRINASLEQNEKYKYPIYGKPYDIVEVNLKDFDNNLPNQKIVGKVNNQKLEKYYTRRELNDNGRVDAPVILWADNPVDIYVMQIQGSAVAYLDDGAEVRIGYAGNNGHQFKGIGSILLERGLIKSGQASMGQIRKWLKENGDLAIDNMLDNERYIFHQLINADGPIGTHGVPLVAGRSVAVDTKYIPLGALLWLETTGPNQEDIEKLVVAQDTGSAIKGAVRGDYFWGSGDDEVLDLAGKMNSQGRYFILLPNDMEIVE